MEATGDLKKIYPTDFEYLVLAAYASQDGTGVIPGQSKIKNGHIPQFQDDDFLLVAVQEKFNYNINEFMKNWNVLEVQDDEQTGYLGVIFKNDIDRQLVLAHRSTNFAGGAYNLFKGSGTQCDIEGVLMCGITLYQRWGYVMTAKAVDYANKLKTKDGQQYSLSVTGHSLGAWMTDLSVYYCHVDLNYTNVKAVTFDGPGSWEMIERLHASSIMGIEAENFKAFDLDITAYFSAPNIVNCTNSHVGIAHCLFPDIKSNKFFEHMEMMKKFFYPSSNAVDAILSTLGHGLENFIPHFDLATGKPKVGEYKRITKWPKILYEGKKPQLKDEDAVAFVNAVKGSGKSDTSTSLTGKIFSVFSQGFGKLFTNLAGYAVDTLTDRDADKTLFKAIFSSDNNGTSTISSLFSLIGSLLNDEISQSQFWIAHSKLKREDGYRPNFQSREDEFVLQEIGGYNVYDPDNYSRRITDTIDGFLSDIKDKEDVLPDSPFDEKFREIVFKVLSKYEKKRGPKGNYLCIQDKHQGLFNITLLRDQMRGLLRDYDKALFGFIDWKGPKLNLELKSHLERLAVSSTDINEIIRVKKFFTKDLMNKRIIAIKSNPKFGKKMLLKHYAEYLIKENNIIVWPFNCETTSSLNSDYCYYAKDIQLNIDNQTPIEIMNSVHSRLKSHGMQMLFLFTNVHKRRSVDPYVSNLPFNIQLIITTNNYGMLLKEDWGAIQLPAFTEEEAIEFINSNFSQITEEDITLILKESQLLPQDLSMLITAIRQSGKPVKKIIEEIQKENHSLYQGFYKKLFTTLMQDNTEAYHLLKYMAWLNHMDISVEFLEQLKTWTDIYSLLDSLEKSCLISNMGNGHYQISRDIQTLVREFQPTWDYISQLLEYFDNDKFPLLTKSNAKVSVYVNNTYQQVKSMIDILFQYKDCKMFHEIMVRHCLKLAKLYQYGLGLLDEAQRYYHKLWELLNVKIEQMTIEQLEYIDDAVEYTYLLIDLQNYEKAEKIAGNLYIISVNNTAEITKYFEGKRFDLSDIEALCGDVEYCLDKFQVAELCYHRAFDQYKGKYGDGPTLRLAELAFNRGKANVRQGKVVEGKKSYLEAYAMMNIISGAKEDKMYTDLLCHLGMIQCKTGNFCKIDNYFEEAIRISHGLSGAIDNSNVVTYQLEYGTYLLNNRKFEQALKVLCNALTISQKLKGSKNQKMTAKLYYTIGKTYQSFESPNYEKAIEAYSTCLELGIQLNIPKLQALSISAIGEIQLHQGMITDCIISLEKAIALKLDNYQVLKNYISQDYKNLASAYANEKEYNDTGKSEELLRQGYLRSISRGFSDFLPDGLFNDNPASQTRTLLSQLECCDSKILRIKKIIQEKILNNLQIYAREGKWEMTGLLQYFQWDITDLVNLKFLQDYLKEDEMTPALMLCFEAINLGVVKANFQNIQFSLDFLTIYKARDLKKEILKCHPEFFVDGIILDYVLANDKDVDLQPRLKKKLRYSPLLEFTITNTDGGVISIILKDEDDIQREMRDKLRNILKKK